MQQGNTYNINCTQCVAGMYPSDPTTCTLCSSTITNCVTCDPTNSGPSCTSCIEKFYTATGASCTPCTDIDSNCYFCNNAGQCTQCLFGYYVNSAFTCTQKPACDVSNCLTCSNTNGSQCLTCNNYFTNAADGSACSPPTNCPYQGQFFDGSTCLCKIGFYFNGSACLSCSLNCAQCTSGTTCTSCLANYFVSASNCVPCGDGCR